MALKFLNKKGWHTGSLRNIENVWKAEQKHEAEKRKLEELKKQIHDEREAQEFRLLQEQAGLVPKQERLEFLYDSGLAVGKNSSDDYLLGKPIEEKKSENEVAKAAAAPGALFVEEKPQSANDTWRKLHTDPLLLIRQQEQAALARIKNNPVKMEMIKKSVQEKISKKEKKRKSKEKETKEHKKDKRKKHRGETGDTVFSKREMDEGSDDDRRNRRLSKKEDEMALPSFSDNYSLEQKAGSAKWNHDRSQRSPGSPVKQCESPKRWHESPKRHHERRSHDSPRKREVSRKHHDSPKGGHESPRKQLDRHSPKRRHDSPNSFEAKRHKRRSAEGGNREEDTKFERQATAKMYWKRNGYSSHVETKQNVQHKSRNLTEEERAARLKEMQSDAEVHEEQRWHRLKKASDADQLEEAKKFSGRNFVDQTARDVYGAAKGGSTSVEESVRRRAHFIDRSLGDSNANTFQRA